MFEKIFIDKIWQNDGIVLEILICKILLKSAYDE